MTHWIRLLPPIACRGLLRPSLELLPPARMIEVMPKTPEIRSYVSILDKGQASLVAICSGADVSGDRKSERFRSQFLGGERANSERFRLDLLTFCEHWITMYRNAR